jgi:3-phosphoshikimate 1-carboxyvinyltransferase
MDWKIIKASKALKGEIKVPADKSVSHRAVMFGSVSSGDLRVENFLFSEDCTRTLDAFRAMGVDIERDGKGLFIRGKGLRSLKSPGRELYMGNSGTTMRVISGILAGQDFSVELTGDDSLSRRPMGRVVEPLKKMGAAVETLNDDRPPIKVGGPGGTLTGIDYISPVASAQIKSCVLAAGMYARGQTSVTEPFQSRDHTERMLEYFSAPIIRKGLTTVISGLKELIPRDLVVPGDISSAAFFIVGALGVPGSDIVLKGVGLNPTRVGMLTVLERMGADIEITGTAEGVEGLGDIRVKAGPLKAAVVEAEEIPLLIDEVPILIIASLLAEGRTVIRGISELKVKESDRIKTMADDLSRMGVKIMEEEGALVIDGPHEHFSAGELDSFGDHRIAMSMAIAALLSDGECVIRNAECVDTSYPDFLADLESLRG